MKIFAYGSNMNIGRLRERVPSVIRLTNAFISGYSLICNKVSIDGSSKANIIKTDNLDDAVWGVVFKIADNEKKYLDRGEGLGNGYSETTLNFTDTNNITHEAQVYIADNNSVDNALSPFDWYKQFITTGAEQNELPSEYLEQVKLIDFVVNTNETRRQRNFKISGSGITKSHTINKS